LDETVALASRDDEVLLQRAHFRGDEPEVVFTRIQLHCPAVDA
jgi:hypothetical protein